MKENEPQNENKEEKTEETSSHTHLATLHEDLTNTTPLTITEEMMAVFASLLITQHDWRELWSFLFSRDPFCLFDMNILRVIM